jgi:hypothetical protein
MKTFLVLLSCVYIAFALSCNNSNSSNKEGKALAENYCGNCHQVPTPGLLDKNSWSQYMLPRMGVFLGIIEHDSLLKVLFEEGPGGEKAKQSGYYPSKPMLSMEEWEKIKTYFIENAPEQLSIPKSPNISKDLSLFEVKIPQHKMSPPSATFVQFNTQDQSIYLGDANTQSLSVFGNDLKLIQAAKVKEGAVWVEEFKEEAFVTVMGSFSPTDVSSGFILSLPKVANRPVFKLIDSLQRPVHSAYADLDADGLPDVVTCEFAKWTGKLSWWKNLGNGQFENRILRNKPGAEKAYIKDLNKDGKDDIIALFGQGDEGIFIYYNEGNGKFREETAIQFSASNKTDAITINGNYSNSKITCTSDYAFDISVSLKYGTFTDNLGLKYNLKSEKNTSKSYTAYHISQGKSKISITFRNGSQRTEALSLNSHLRNGGTYGISQVSGNSVVVAEDNM